MNHPKVWTTINKTPIDLSFLPVDMVPLTGWAIYPGLLSDHLAVLLEIQHQHNTTIVQSQRDGSHNTQTGNSTKNILRQLQQTNITKAIPETA